MAKSHSHSTAELKLSKCSLAEDQVIPHSRVAKAKHGQALSCEERWRLGGTLVGGFASELKRTSNSLVRIRDV